MRKKNPKNKFKKRALVHKHRFKKTNSVSPRKSRQALLSTVAEVKVLQAKFPPGSAASCSHTLPNNNQQKKPVSILRFVLVYFSCTFVSYAVTVLLGVVLWIWGCLGKLCSLNCAVANLPNTNKNFVCEKVCEFQKEIFQQIESSRIFKWPKISKYPTKKPKIHPNLLDK